MSDSAAHPGYVTVAQISALHRIPRAEVYRLANEHKWRRYTLTGRVRYHVDDVVNTLSPDDDGKPRKPERLDNRLCPGRSFT